jgi:hypothetical protein
MCEGCFSQSRRAVKKNMFHRFVSLSGGSERDNYFFENFSASDALVKTIRAKRKIVLFFISALRFSG